MNFPSQHKLTGQLRNKTVPVSAVLSLSFSYPQRPPDLHTAEVPNVVSFEPSGDQTKQFFFVASSLAPHFIRVVLRAIIYPFQSSTVIHWIWLYHDLLIHCRADEPLGCCQSQAVIIRQGYHDHSRVYVSLGSYLGVRIIHALNCWILTCFLESWSLCTPRVHFKHVISTIWTLSVRMITSAPWSHAGYVKLSEPHQLLGSVLCVSTAPPFLSCLPDRHCSPPAS